MKGSENEGGEAETEAAAGTEEEVAVATG